MTGEELIESAIETWRLNKGIGTAVVPSNLNDKVLMYQLLCKIYTRSPTCDTLIVVTSFKDRTDIIEFLTHQDEENDAEFKKLIAERYIKILTADYIKLTGYIKKCYLFIGYRLEDLISLVNWQLEHSKFKLVILNKLFKNNEDSAKLYKVCPVLDTFKQTQLEQLRMSTPVEEMYCPIDLVEGSEDKRLYDYYSEYIETSINIFGSFDVIKQARIGDSATNISSAMICYQIAKENGWNEHLNMDIEYNRQTDEMFNPNNLKDRATQVYEIIRNRTQLVADYPGKFERILDIVHENEGKKILIINKRGEFASKVTDYLNNLSEHNICGNYHDKVDNVPAVDIYGNPIYIKSGSKAGERRMYGAKAQKSLNEQLFNIGKINVISTNAAPDKDLNIEVDVVIITSPLCESIESYLYRLSKVRFKDDKVKLYSLFCKNTIEEKQLLNKPTTDTHEIVNKDEISATAENNYAFFIAD